MEFKLFNHISEIEKYLQANKPRLVKADSKTICIIKKEEGLIAFENECPHLGEALHRGKINFQNEITCPWHSYRFSLDTGEEIAGRCQSLKFIKVTQSKRGVFLHLY